LLQLKKLQNKKRQTTVAARFGLPLPGPSWPLAGLLRPILARLKRQEGGGLGLESNPNPRSRRRLPLWGRRRALPALSAAGAHHLLSPFSFLATLRVRPLAPVVDRPSALPGRRGRGPLAQCVAAGPLRAYHRARVGRRACGRLRVCRRRWSYSPPRGPLWPP
jgi:hypothetical protein